MRHQIRTAGNCKPKDLGQQDTARTQCIVRHRFLLFLKSFHLYLLWVWDISNSQCWHVCKCSNCANLPFIKQMVWLMYNPLYLRTPFYWKLTNMVHPTSIRILLLSETLDILHLPLSNIIITLWKKNDKLSEKSSSHFKNMYAYHYVVKYFQNTVFK